MKRLLICALLIAAPAIAQQPQQVPPPGPIVVGAVMPQSGNLADLAADLRKALLLWQEEVNAGGGLLGRRVELLLLDDRSESGETGKLYQQLIIEHQADLLIGPLGSAATLGTAAVAERSRRVLMNATGSSRLVHKSGFRYVFQSSSDLAAYGMAALELARRNGLKRIMLLARDEPNSREIAVLARENAMALGLSVADVEVYPAGADVFAPQVARARSFGAEAWIAFGLPPDAVEMVKNLRKLGFAPRLFVVQGAADAEFVKRVGQDAEYAIGISAYERSAATRGNAQFVQAYATKWSAEPGLLAAEGYAAAKVLEQAVRRAGSVDQEKLREALGALETETPLGPYK